MLVLSLCCIALLVVLGGIAGPLLILDDWLERRRAVLEAELLGQLDDPVAVPPAALPAPRPTPEGAPGPPPPPPAVSVIDVGVLP